MPQILTMIGRVSSYCRHRIRLSLDNLKQRHSLLLLILKSDVATTNTTSLVLEPWWSAADLTYCWLQLWCFDSTAKVKTGRSGLLLPGFGIQWTGFDTAFFLASCTVARKKYLFSLCFTLRVLEFPRSWWTDQIYFLQQNHYSAIMNSLLCTDRHCSSLHTELASHYGHLHLSNISKKALPKLDKVVC